MIKRFQKSNSILWRIQVGYLCNSCKNRIKNIEEIYYDVNAVDNYCLCKVCKRDVDIDSLTGNIKTKLHNKIRILLIKDFRKLSIVHFTIVALMVGVGITFNIKYLSTLVNVMNFVYAYVNYKRVVMMTEKED